MRIDDPLMKSAHLIGVCGAGMKALVQLLVESGWRVSGSDLSKSSPAIEALIQRGLVFHQGHHRTNLPPSAECVIYSPAISPNNVERLEAGQRRIPQWSYSEMVGWLMRSRTGVCIAGTHGKSTTTAMVATILANSGCDPSWLVGADLRKPLPCGKNGLGELFVVESCEFQQSFLDFSPRYAAILNVEPDHFDCYADLPSLVTAFNKFASRVAPDGVIVARGDCPATLESVRGIRARVVTFGCGPNCEWQVAGVRHAPEGALIEIRRKGIAWSTMKLAVHGAHNAQNALAAAALCAEIGLSAREIVDGIQLFRGVHRRFDVVGDWNGVTLIDDYAHHPTAVRATLQTARTVYGSRSIWCIFQPHQVSRTIGLMDDFASCFDLADRILIAPVFAARERLNDEPRLTSLELTGRIAGRGKSVQFVESLDQIVATVEDAARPGDVVIAMGAGDIDRIHHELTGRVC